MNRADRRALTKLAMRGRRRQITEVVERLAGHPPHVQDAVLDTLPPWHADAVRAALRRRRR